MTGLPRSPRLVAAAGVILLWCGAGALLAVWYSARIRDWSVMTDELQYVKLALSVWETGSPLPSLHGMSAAVANQLYPLLLAPVYGPLSSTEAFRTAHVLNAMVMTSAAVPAYLLARELLDRAWSFAVAVLTIALPWMVLVGFLMSEVAGYPALLWAVLAFQRCVVAPSPRRDALAAAALLLAILARTQFAALALVLPVAILAHELAEARAGRPGVRERIGSGVRAAIRRHRTLSALYAVGVVVALALLLTGRRPLGAYSTTVESGSVLPAGVWWFAVEHLAVVALGCGVVPVLLGGGWMLATLARPSSPPRRAFATLVLLTVAVLAVETASFDLRFGGEDLIRDRYLFYVVPLFFVAATAALTEQRKRPILLGMAGTTALMAAASVGLPYTTFPGISVDSPVSILNETLAEQSGSLGTGTFVAIAMLLVGLVLMLALAFSPPLPLAVALFACVLVVSLLTLRAEVDRILDGTGLSGRPLAGPPGVVLDWVDAVIPEGGSASIVAYPLSVAWGVSAIQWWDVEFWNRTVTRAFVAEDENYTYTPFQQSTLEIDPVTGVIDGTADAPAYVVGVPGDSRFGLAGTEHADNAGLRVTAAERPYRAVWSSRGLQEDGWTTPGVPATIRVHAPPGSQDEQYEVLVFLRAPDGVDARYELTAANAGVGDVIAGGEATEATLIVCVGPRRPADVTLLTSTSALIEGPPLTPEPGPHRLVGAQVGQVVVDALGRPCDGA